MDAQEKSASAWPELPLRLRLMAGISLLAIAAGSGMPTAAEAQACTTVSTDTTVSSSTSPCITWTGGNLTISGTIPGTTDTSVQSSGNVGMFNNSGTLANGFINTLSGTIVSVENSGLIFGGVTAFVNHGNVGTLTNSGTITNATGAGLSNSSTIEDLINTGTITGATVGVYNNGTLLGLSNNAGGTINSVSNFGTIAFLTNAFGGSINLVENNSVLGLNVATALTNLGNIGTLENYVAIAGTSAGIANLFGGTIGLFQNSSGTISSVTNAGQIGTGVTALTNSSTIGTLTNSGEISGSSYGVINSGSMGTLTNSGTITGPDGGITNDNTAMIGALINMGPGFINTVINNGTIGDGPTAISNAGTIDRLTNSGVIAGTSYGILNTTGTITVITNQGTIVEAQTGIANISGTIGSLFNGGDGTINSVNNAGQFGTGYYSSGIANSGTIGTLTNTGTITGSMLGVFNAGQIALIDNLPGGTIDGAHSGLQNTFTGTIVTMSNAGIINGGSYGIENYSTITTLTNSGTISAETGAAIYNNFSGGSVGGNIGSLDNSGTIIGTIGAAAIVNAGTGAVIGPITNSGLIYGPIMIENQDVDMIGGTGNVFGTLAGGTISVLNGNLTFSSGNQLLADDILVSSAGGTPGGGAVVNSGLVQVNTTHGVTGAYNQTSTGALVIGIGGTLPGQYGRLTSSGIATFTGGLAVTTLGNFALASGQRYDIFNFASRTGDFTSFALNGIAWTADGADIWTDGMATVTEIFVGSTELDLAMLGTFPPPTPTPPLSNNIDTARGSYLASNLGSAVNPVFEGGVLQTNQTNASYTQNFSLAPAVPNTIDQTGNTTAFSGVFSDATVGQPGSIVISNSGSGGSVTFSGVNSYTGSTTVNPGATLMLAGAGSVAASSGVTDNGTFNVANVNAQTSITTLSGNGSVPLGNNTLTLTQASDTFAGGFSGNGGVTLAAGAETLTGTSTIGGTLAVNGGTLHQDGTFTADAVTVASGGTLRGTGLIAAPTSVSGVLAPGNSPGTMIFTAPVTLNSNATFALDIDGMGTGNGAGNYSRVVVQGASFTAAGVIAPVLRGITGSANNNFSPPIGSVYNVVLATGGVQGSFTGLVQPSAGLLPGTHFDALYSPTTINLYITPTSYADLAAIGEEETASEAQIGLGIDALRGITGQRVDATTSALLDTLYRLPGPAIPEVLEGLNSAIYGDLLFAGIERNRAFADAMAEQSAAGRGSAAPAGASSEQIGPLTLWLTGTGGAESISGPDGTTSQNYGGGAVGVGRKFDDFTLGFAVGGSGGSLSLGSQRATTQSVSVGVYGGWERGRWYIDGNLDVFGTDDATTRIVALGDLQARGHARGVGVGAGMETGMTFEAGPAKIEPFVGMRIDNLNRTSSTEEGAGVFNETIGSGSATSVRSSIGVRAETELALGGIELKPSASLSWAHEFGDITTTTSAGFGGGPAVLDLASTNGGRDAAVIGVGLTTPITSKLTGYVNYSGDVRQNATGQIFSAGLRLIW